MLSHDSGTLFMLCQHPLYWRGSTSPIPFRVPGTVLTIYSCIYPLDKKEQVSLFPLTVRLQSLVQLPPSLSSKCSSYLAS